MSANENVMRSAHLPEDAENRAKAKPNAAYYQMLAERLEVLLRDVQAKGTPPDDALLLRLADLLAETRGRLRKAPKEI